LLRKGRESLRMNVCTLVVRCCGVGCVEGGREGGSRAWPAVAAALRQTEKVWCRHTLDETKKGHAQKETTDTIDKYN